jgi:hypothetical protein
MRWSLATHRPFACEGTGRPSTARPASGLDPRQACGACRTDLDIVDDKVTPPKLLLVAVQEIIGSVALVGDAAARFHVGDLSEFRDLAGAVNAPLAGAAGRLCPWAPSPAHR